MEVCTSANDQSINNWGMSRTWLQFPLLHSMGVHNISHMILFILFYFLINVGALKKATCCYFSVADILHEGTQTLRGGTNFEKTTISILKMTKWKKSRISFVFMFVLSYNTSWFNRFWVMKQNRTCACSSPSRDKASRMLRQAVARSAMDCHSSSVESVVSERTEEEERSHNSATCHTVFYCSCCKLALQWQRLPTEGCCCAKGGQGLNTRGVSMFVLWLMVYVFLTFCF